jgi:hypothetical protein
MLKKAQNTEGPLFHKTKRILKLISKSVLFNPLIIKLLCAKIINPSQYTPFHISDIGETMSRHKNGGLT